MEQTTNYKKLEILGEGAFGKVYLIENEHGHQSALKELKGCNSSTLEQAKEEAKLLYGLDHQNIIKFKDLQIKGDNISIVTEYAGGGSLQAKIDEARKKRALFEEVTILRWMKQMCRALKYIHSKNIIHRDIKPANILLSGEGTVKLADMGVSKLLDSATAYADTFAGSKPFMSPETLDGKPYNSKTDIWSLGVVLYQLWTLKLPFKSLSDTLNAKYTPLDSEDPITIRKLISRTLTKDPQDRASAKEVLSIIKEGLKSGPKAEESKGRTGGYEESKLAEDMTTLRLAPPETVSPYQILQAKKLVPEETKIIDPLGSITCKQILSGQIGPIYCVKQLQDGRIAGSSAFGKIKIWNAKTGECDLTLEGHTDAIWGLAACKNGKLASGSEDKTIRIWNVHNGACEQTLKSPSQVFLLTELNDGRLAAPCNDKLIRIWNASTATIEKTLKGHTLWVWEVIQLQDSRLASSSMDRTVRIWNITKGKCETVLKGHENFVKGLCQLEDGRLASGSLDKTIRIWNLSTGACDKVIKVHSYYVNKVLPFSKTQIISASDDGTIKVTDIRTGKCEKTFADHKGCVYGLTLLQEKEFASGGYDNTVKIWQ